MMRSTRVRLSLLALGIFLTAGAAEAQTSIRSWTADRRDFETGDVITVLIDEYTLAASNQGDFASDRSFNDLGLGLSQSITSASAGADLSSSNQAENRKRGEATRQNRFQGEMTVRVIGVEESGLLKVEGRKVVNIGETSEELLLRGFIRPEDVSPRNMVDSWRVADTELVYTTNGPSPRGSFLGRLLGWIWP